MTRAQCLEAGLTPRAIERRLNTMGWSKWLPNVYLLPGISPDQRGRLRAALLWGGKEAVLSHASAAYVHALEGSSAADKAELYVPTGKTSPKVRTHRLPLTPLEKANVRGLRVTRVERTLSDLSCRWAPARAGEAMDDSLRRGLTTLDRLGFERDNARIERRPGSAVFSRLVQGRDHRDAKVRSRFETKTLRLLKQVQAPIPDYPVAVANHRYFLDFAYPTLTLGIECQSIRWHLGEEAFKADMTRHRRLTAAGWAVLFVCWDEVMFEADRLQREISEALQARRQLIQPELLPNNHLRGGFSGVEEWGGPELTLCGTQGGGRLCWDGKMGS